MDGENQSSVPSSLCNADVENPQRSSENKEEEPNRGRRSKAWEEMKQQLWLSGPLIAVSFLQYCLQVISVMFVGHLGKLPLSGASLATSFAYVTGFSLVMGMASALDTLCGQSYGAKVYHMLGIHMQRAMLVLVMLSIPLSIIWANTKHVLILLAQDHAIAEQAGSYALFLIPSLFAYGILQCLNKFLQTQKIVFPMMLGAGITTLVHLLLCWVLVFKSSLGHRGAALAISISYWINVLLLGLYVRFSSSCSKTWTGFSREATQKILSFLWLAIPSAVMICLEYWSFHIMAPLAGLLPNPVLETSGLSICLNTVSAIYTICVGLSGAISTRVSNELGAGRPKMARLAVCVVLVLIMAVGILVGAISLLIRNVWGRAYSHDKEVIQYVATMMPLIVLFNFLDGIQCVLSGVARGCGWQKKGAYINLGSYYLIGVPLAVLFAFVLHLRGKGLWLGIIIALVVQVFLLLAITIRTNWDQEAKNATDRVQNSSVPENTET